MKIRTFILTFAAFSVTQALRIAYSYNKNQIIKKFDVDEMFLGSLDSLHWLSVAIGAVFHFSIIKQHRLLQTYLCLSILTSLGSSLFPICSLLFQETIISDDTSKDLFIKKAILIASMMLFGFSSFAVWSLNFKLVSKYYNVQKEGKWLGIWSAGWEVGNIYGLFYCQILIRSLKVRWQMIIIIFAVLNLVFSSMMYLFLENPESKKNVDLQGQIVQEVEQITTEIFLKDCKQNLKNKELGIYILINGFMTALFTALLFWIPTYIITLNYQTIAGYFAMIIDVAAIIGSFVLGMTYEKQNNSDQTGNSHFLCPLKQYLSDYLSYIVLILTILTTLAWICLPPHIILYASLIAILGFFLGGLSNCIRSNDLVIETHNDPRKTQMLAVFINITSSIIISVSCLLIGIAIHSRTIYHDDGLQNTNLTIQKQSPYIRLFYAIIVAECIILFLFFLRKKYLKLNIQYDIIEHTQKQSIVQGSE